MGRVKKTKLYKLSLFLLGLMVLINFSFCLMPLTVSAQILNQPEEIIPEVSQEAVDFNTENSCEDTGHNYKTEAAAFQETKTEPSDNTSDKNTVLPCCLDHDKITQINNAPKPEINDVIFYTTSENNSLDYEVLIQNSAYNQALDLPPPKTDNLFSVYKKE